MQAVPTTNPRRKATPGELFMALSSGFLPYVGGGLLVIWTRQIVWIVTAGALITLISTFGAYLLRRTTDAATAKARLLVDPMLYGVEFALTAVLVRYVLMR